MLIQMVGLIVLAFTMVTLTANTILNYDQKVALHTQSDLVRGTMERAKSQLLADVQEAESQGVTPGAFTYTPGNVCSGAGNTTPNGKPCPWTESVTYTPSGGTNGESQANGTDVTALNLNSGAGEQRLSYNIEADLISTGKGSSGQASGTARREGFMTMRVYNAAPYADVVGFVDTTANFVQQVQEGDSSGCDPSNMAACDIHGTPQQTTDSGNDTTGGDTRLVVQATCAPSGDFSCTDSTATPPPASYSNATYTNTNEGN